MTSGNLSVILEAENKMAENKEETSQEHFMLMVHPSDIGLFRLTLVVVEASK